MDRQDYAFANQDKYNDWCKAVEDSPFDAVEKLEFAIISAHTLFAKSISGFLATRGLEDMQSIGNALYHHGVTAPGNKAAYILGLRDMVLYGDTPLPEPCYQEYRKAVKLPGLGYCKLSFGACLIAPFDANIVCLDTHILQLYLGYMPSRKEVARHYTKLDSYASIEGQLLSEANEVGLAPFAYQWAVWDYKRAKVDHKSPQDHSFLWQSGQTQYQMPMFSSTA